MSNRERWIVYPLLFFAMMLGLSDLLQRSGMITDWTGPPRFREIRCRQLVIEGIDRQPLAIWNQNVFGEAQLSLLNSDAIPTAMLTAGEGGGQLILLRTSDGKAIFLGHHGEQKFSGLEAVELHNQQVRRLEENPAAVEVMNWEK